MDLNVFATAKMDEYAKKAKEQWGHTTEYKEYEEKVKNQSPDAKKRLGKISCLYLQSSEK